MSTLLSVAVYTFREAVRNKILYSILFFAVALILLALAIGPASLSQDERIIKDVGFFALSFFGVVVAIFLGVTMLYQELDRKTIYTVLSKPVSRHSYFVGKYLGMAITLAAQVGIMAGALTAVVLLRGDDTGATYFYAILLAWVESLVIAGIALFFSSFSTPYVSGFLAFGVFLVGRLLPELEAFLPTVDVPIATALGGVVIAIAPDLQLFTLSTQIDYDIPVSGLYVAHAASYGLCYAGLFLLAGAAIFHRRDFI